MSSLNRRQFLSLSATLGAGIFAAPAFLRAQSPNSKLNLAIIGAAGKGSDNLGKFLGHNIVALCDVDTKGIDKAKAQIEKGQGKAFAGKEYRDYRKLFDNLKDYDAVVISTPDHHHYPATIRALKLKKHVYCEKPLTHTIGEAREIARAAKEAGVATQMGNQGNASEDLRVITEWIKAGVIGKVKEVHSWSNRPVWPQGVTWPAQADAPCRRISTGTCGSDQPRTVRTTPRAIRSSGAASGISAPALSATWAATFSTGLSPLSTSARPWPPSASPRKALPRTARRSVPDPAGLRRKGRPPRGERLLARWRQPADRRPVRR